MRDPEEYPQVKIELENYPFSCCYSCHKGQDYPRDISRLVVYIYMGERRTAEICLECLQKGPAYTGHRIYTEALEYLDFSEDEAGKWNLIECARLLMDSGMPLDNWSNVYEYDQKTKAWNEL
jgi:hypothetical protein